MHKDSANDDGKDLFVTLHLLCNSSSSSFITLGEISECTSILYAFAPFIRRFCNKYTQLRPAWSGVDLERHIVYKHTFYYPAER